MARFSWLAAVAAVAAVGGTARAEVVTTFIGTDPFQTVNVSGTNANGPRAFTSPVGPFNFLVQSDGGLGLGQTFRSFCSDYFQDVGLGNDYIYTPIPFETLPDINGNPTKVQKVQELFDRFYDVANTDATGAAFQLALWEILYDPTNTNLSNGNFTAIGPGDPTGIAIAQNWLNTIGDSSIPDPAQKYSLLGLYSVSAQDQILVGPAPVPAPAGVILLVIGAGALIARRRLAGKTEVVTEDEVKA